MKLKRIVAISGVVVLALLYIVTFISAMFTSKAAPELFRACVAATFAVPVFMYAYLLIYKLTKQRSEAAKKELDDAIQSIADETGNTETADDDNNDNNVNNNISE